MGVDESSAESSAEASAGTGVSALRQVLANRRDTFAEVTETSAEPVEPVADTYAETDAATRPPPDEASASADEHELAFLNSFLDLVRRIAAAASPPPSASP